MLCYVDSYIPSGIGLQLHVVVRAWQPHFVRILFCLFGVFMYARNLVFLARFGVVWGPFLFCASLIVSSYLLLLGDVC